MFTTVAPADIASANTSQTKSGSLRVASIAENSTCGHIFFAKRTVLPVSSTSSRLEILSCFSMCMSEVEITVCSSGRSADFSASHVRSSWFSLNPESAAISTSRNSRLIVSTALKSPGEVEGNPASITSTLRRVSWRPISSFSSRVSAPPAACSPSRSVVSKIRICLNSGAPCWKTRSPKGRQIRRRPFQDPLLPLPGGGEGKREHASRGAGD